MNAYQHTRNGIIKAGFNPERIEALGNELVAIKNTKDSAVAYSAFEAEAETLPWPWDHDFGALVLQSMASKATDEIAKFMLTKAIERAHWCATCATSGGEGLARAEHIKALKNDLAQYQ